MNESHYFFPPASAYPLNRCLFLLKSDSEFRARYVATPDAAMDAVGVTGDARKALRAFERDPLIALGAHPYLVFMADLRLKMDRAPTAFEHF